MTDLRDQLPAFEAAARRLLNHERLVLVRAATCHPERPEAARRLCRSCYNQEWSAGRLPNLRRIRRRVDFIPDYELLRSEGHSRRQIAERMGVSVNAVTQAYLRAVRAGDLEPDRKASA